MFTLKSFDKDELKKLNMNIPLSIKSIQLLMLDELSDFSNSEVRNLFVNANEYYPEFQSWYESKLIEDAIESQSLHKDFFIENSFFNKGNDHPYHNHIPSGRLALVAAVNDKLAGLSVLKKHPDENKISTFYINKKYNRFGLGSFLLESSLSLFNDQPVNITVSEDSLDEMAPFLIKNGFKEYKSIDGEYKKNKKEMHFRK
ncbi:GNAT family N-acetyltransferase [Serratia sp. CY84636]|uniref:GNAT family N-acetyltransferase n=1 Tax=Serratia sp. CY84636 TaxID=3383695 RepID=UPI003FA074EF